MLSFGHRYGLPEGFDVILDLRSLQVPSLKWSLKGLTGLDPIVRSTVLGSKKCQALLEQCRKTVEDIMQAKMPDKNRVMVAVGCAGGRHRAVAVAEELCRSLKSEGFSVTLQHRDIHKHLWHILMRK